MQTLHVVVFQIKPVKRISFLSVWSVMQTCEAQGYKAVLASVLAV
jgi:hypothetical protein